MGEVPEAAWGDPTPSPMAASHSKPETHVLERITHVFGVCPSLRPLSNPLLEDFTYPASTLLKHLVPSSCTPSRPVFQSRCFAAELLSFEIPVLCQTRNWGRVEGRKVF